jgi:hypothetical protein
MHKLFISPALMPRQVIRLALGTAIAMFLAVSPLQAQYADIKDVLRNTPSSRLAFSPHTVGVVIAGFSNRVYMVNAVKGQTLSLDLNSMGARAGVVIYDVNGKKMTNIISKEGRDYTYELPKSGDYYILCIAGPTNHYYDLTLRIN